jgi:UDPglucose 6-dehydrogenase
MKKVKVGIVGYGFVGKATAKGFSKNTELFLVDPLLGTNLSDLKEFIPEFIFICLPTPMKKDGSQDFTLVKEVFMDILSNKISSTIILKSTVIPSNIKIVDNLIEDYIYNPEFLREKHAEEDFINSSMIILGGSKNNQEKVKNLYENHSICKTKNYVLTDKITASLIKYSINSFLASKVIFFNELRDLFNSSGAEEDWDTFTDVLAMDKRIGNSHMDVPGHDGRLGFGGACFTKDTAALIKYSQSLEKELSLLKKAIEINNNIRSKYDQIDQREKDQNVNYEFDD